MNWSHFQKDIYHAFEFTQDSLLIEAVAGSGKTRTLEELARIMGERMPGLRGIMVAFNKSIAVELQSRIDKYGFRNVQAMTLHSAGWAAWRRAGGLDWEPRVNQHKVSGIMREVLSYEENKRFGETTRKLVSAAKGIGLVPKADFMEFAFKREVPEYRGLVQDWDDTWLDLIEHYSLDEGDCNIDCVRRVLAESIKQAKESCDFDDMLYMPVIAGVPFDKYDVVLVDEAQDVSGIQMEMIERMVGGECLCALIPASCPIHGKGQGRVIAVGDRAQACYGFRGAGTDSMDQLKSRFQMRELPLSVTYRCPVAVVEHARRWVPQIEARSPLYKCLGCGEFSVHSYTYCDKCKGTSMEVVDGGAPWGYVGLEGTDWRGQAEVALGAEPVPPLHDIANLGGELGVMAGIAMHTGITKWRGISDFQPGDAILCRLTRPLVAAAFTLIRARIAGVHVLGRDIAGGLIAIVKKAKSLQNAHLEAFARWLEDYEHREGERLRRRQKFAQAGLLADKCDTIRVFINQLGEDATVPELIAEIERLFVDANSGTARMVTLATIHKAKGLEWERVFVLDAGELMPCPWARGNAGWEIQQERNLMYVAATRAMRELRYITTGDLR